MLKDKFKIKPLTKSQIVISLDRLTRFKSTEDKYLRVFKDILISNLIEPKYKKSQLDLMDYEKLTELAQEIFNYSLKMIKDTNCHAELVSASFQYTKLNRSRNKFGMTNSDELIVNQKLLEYEKSVFKFDKNVESLLKNKIDYNSALVLFKNETLPNNLKWLKSLANDGDSVQKRIASGFKFPIEKVVIVEGITEEILLPKFAKICGYDFDKVGIALISAGGKNQVVKLFYKLSDELKLPIFVLLDNDASDSFNEIKSKLRIGDEVHIINNGEFEDILPLNLIKRTLNKNFLDYSEIVLDDLRLNLPMTQTLTEVFKQRGLEFKKAEFAALISENILSKKDVSSEIEKIVNILSKVAMNNTKLLQAST